MKNQIGLVIILAIFLIPFIAHSQTNYEDVVYLKNGSILHGTIVEQIPNQSIKIETRDGNVFHFKIDEIAKMTKEPKDNLKNSRYKVFISMRNGEKLTGKLILRTPDSLSVLNAWNAKPLEVSKIKSIRIRQKNALPLGFGLGAGGGAIIGALIGYATYSRSSNCSNGLFGCIDIFDQETGAIEGAVIGAAVGTLLGGAIGSGSGREFKIEGNQTQFDLFTNEFKNKGF